VERTSASQVTQSFFYEKIIPFSYQLYMNFLPFKTKYISYEDIPKIIVLPVKQFSGKRAKKIIKKDTFL
jgi:hypothetical protein